MLLLDRLRGMFSRKKALSVVPSAGGWFPVGGWSGVVREAAPGNWQRNIEVNVTTASTFYADFACKTLIARDIAKLPICLKAKDKNGIWVETTNPAFSPVLRKPNSFQTRNQFWEHWMLSKLGRGNTYVLKLRDSRRVVVALFVLDPRRVTPLIAEDGSVFYRLDSDPLHELFDNVTVPASEIIHDRMNCMFHPLVGIPPIFASALAAMQGINIQSQSIRLFQNNAQPGGVLTAPGNISDDDVKRMKEEWQNRFGGENFGRVAVLGSGLKFEQMTFTSEEAQLVEQLKFSAENVCSTYHVPPYKIGVGAMPSYDNVQALNVEYYSQSLQSLIEDAESCLDDGLGLGEQYNLGVEFDVDNLLRMDTATLMEVLDKGKNLMTPDEARARINYPPVEGGNVVYRQQQDYSLAALAKRDAKDDPFASNVPKPPAAPSEPDPALTEADKALAASRLTKQFDALSAGSAA